jgi:tetratricopeptide (TPR) repeat protein
MRERLSATLADRYRIEREVGRGGMATVRARTRITRSDTFSSYWVIPTKRCARRRWGRGSIRSPKSAGTSAALALAFARRGPEAIAATHRVLALDSNFALAFQTLGVAQGISGQPDSAVRSLERARKLSPGMPGLFGKLLFAYAAAGRWADAERIRAELHRLDGYRSGGIEAAYADFVVGDREPLVRLLTTEAGQRRWHEQYLFGCNPLIDPLWSDERFVAAMRKLTIEPCRLARPWPFPPRPQDPRP